MKKYINSGILEIYILGEASDEEVKELMYMKAKHPEVNEALNQLEIDMEKMASSWAVTPPPGTWDKIEDEINDIILREQARSKPVQFRTSDRSQNSYEKHTVGEQYIAVEAESNHMRLHKSWRLVFAAVFVLGKIFLGFAIYFYLENRQTQQQLQELKMEIKQLKK